MRGTLKTYFIACIAAVGLSLGALSTAASAQAVATVTGGHGKRVCGSARFGEASCHAVKLVDAVGQAVSPFVEPAANRAVISGKMPADIRSGYNLGSSSSGGRIVAIVDAYGYPNAEHDLGVYRAKFALPACTTANGCLRIVNQGGGSSLPRTDLGWAQEQALDMDAVSATCPDCRILLVQASSPSFANLGTAVNTAASTAGVAAISNSYGGADASDSSYGTYYNHPGIAVTASTGDNGYQGGSFPASSHYVTAVGGTSLTKASNARGWTESAWSGTGSGCSTLNVQPDGQQNFATNCSGRAIADLSAVADPQTGLAVYAPTSARSSSWAQYGGTSLSSPIIAAVYAMSGNTGGYANTIPYAHPAGMYDVTSGANGSCPAWCTAKVGWDGPTGLGTPNGTSAF
ncbi:MAG: peptidase S8 [Actinomycetota bacterium]|nr:peptidase S8 [Actinomycetota bacterium]